MRIIDNRIEVVNLLKGRAFVPHNIIGILENTTNKGYISEDDETIWIENDYFNYISGSSDIIADKIEKMEDGFYGFSGVEGDLAETVYSKHFLHWFEPTERYVFSGEIPKINTQYEVVKIPLEEAKGIDDRYEYQQEGSLKRIEEAILNRPTAAIYINDELASYVLVHEDNSIGYMYTLEKYRQEGLGYIVTLDILRQMTEKGFVPFVEINMRNVKSQKLAFKTGFVKDAFMPWFGIIKGFPDDLKSWKPLGDQPCFFTTVAQLRYGDAVESDIECMVFTKDGDDYMASVEENHRRSDIRFKLDESKEAYLVDIRCAEGLDIVQLVKAIGVHFPESNASFVFEHEKALEDNFKGLHIGKR